MDQDYSEANFALLERIGSSLGIPLNAYIHPISREEEVKQTEYFSRNSLVYRLQGGRSRENTFALIYGRHGVVECWQIVVELQPVLRLKMEMTSGDVVGDWITIVIYMKMEHAKPRKLICVNL